MRASFLRNCKRLILLLILAVVVIAAAAAGLVSAIITLTGAY